jgi:hypothetical protein
MPLEMLWFILAGFALGFATSTLWEWFYYRRQRAARPDPILLARVADLEAQLARLQHEADSAAANSAPATAGESAKPESVPDSVDAAAAYQSRAALLASEQAGLLAEDAATPVDAAQRRDTPPSTPEPDRAT